MKRQISNTHFLTWTLLAIFIMLLAPEKMFAGNDVMGEVRFEGRSNVEKTSGVWIDGQYVGYLKELKGSKKVACCCRASTPSSCDRTDARILRKKSSCNQERRS